MKKYILSLVAVLVLSILVVPSFSFAQRNSSGGSRGSNNTTTGSSTTTATTGGSAVVGDVDPNTDASQCLSLVNNLRYRDRDANKNGEVSTLQDFLQSAGYLNSEPTGYFGLMTQKAVKSFQSANGISPSGYVGPITRAKIKTISCGDVVIDDTKGECAISKFTVNGSSSANIKIDEGATLAWETVNCTSIKISSISGSSPLPLSGTQFLYHPQTGAILLYAYKNDSLAKIKSVNVVVGSKSDPSITVLSPNGGEIYKVGDRINIKWSSSNLTEDPSKVIEAPIRIWVSCGSNIGTSISVPNTGSAFYELSSSNYTPSTLCRAGVQLGVMSPIKDFSDNYFTITSSTTTGPTISGISGPQTLNVGQQGTWTVNAYDNSIPGSSGNLSYSVVWGDAGVACPSGASCSLVPTAPLQQSATFTHTYSTAGNYTPTFYVTNGNGKTSHISLSVNVGNVTTPSNTLLPPDGLSAAKGIDGSRQYVDLSWKVNAMDSDGTKIYRDGKEIGSVPKGINEWSLTQENKFRDINLINFAGKNVSYYVRAYKGTKESQISNSIIVKIDPVLGYPGFSPVKNIKAEVLSAKLPQSIKISWDLSEGADYYKVRRSGDGGGIIGTTSINNFIDTNFVCSKYLTYSVDAYDSIGNLQSSQGYSIWAPDCVYLPQITKVRDANDWTLEDSVIKGGGTVDVSGLHLKNGIVYLGGNKIIPSRTENTFLLFTAPQLMTQDNVDFYIETPSGKSNVSKVKTISSGVVNIPAPVINISANPTTVISGGTSIISWSSDNATSCTGSDGTYTGSKTFSGSQIAGPLTKDTTYSITCKGAGGETTKSVLIKVEQPNRTVSLTADNYYLNYNGSTILRWTSTGGATSCKGTNFNTNDFTNGSTSTGNLTVSSIYTITCYYPDGKTTTDYKTISVNPIPAPVINISANPTTVISGGTSTISWSSTNTTSCTGSEGTDGWAKAKIASPSLNSENVRVLIPTVFKITCVGTTGTTVSNSVTVGVNDAYYEESTIISQSSNALNAFNGINSVTKNKETNTVPVLVNSESSCQITSTLSKGMDNPEVKCLQQLLNKKGFNVKGTEGGKEITFFGYNTLVAVKKFQASLGSVADGIVGANTRKLLTE